MTASPEFDGNISDMDRQRTLLDLIQTLRQCLAELDEMKATVAAAHLSACLDALESAREVDS